MADSEVEDVAYQAQQIISYGMWRNRQTTVQVFPYPLPIFVLLNKEKSFQRVGLLRLCC